MPWYLGGFDTAHPTLNNGSTGSVAAQWKEEST